MECVSKKKSCNACPKSHSDIKFWFYLFGISVAAFYSRLKGIAEPEWVCWDETHFGKYINHYMNRSNFFDVHPPIGKLILTLFGAVTGYDGQFSFNKPGTEYGTTNFQGMRKACAILGALSCCVLYAHVFAVTGSRDAACIAALFVLFDHSNVIIVRYILLDPLLIFFTVLSLFTFYQAYFLRSNASLYKLSFGISIGILIGIKYNGLFTYAFIVLLALRKVWTLFTDLNISMLDFVAQLCDLAFFALLVPLSVYLIGFYVHASLLTASGPGDDHYSLPFQAKLIGNSFGNSYHSEFLLHGSIVLLKGPHYQSSYLHSHKDTYPTKDGESAPQQQVTGYYFNDTNSRWLVRKVNRPYPRYSNSTLDYIRHGDYIVLEHLKTKKNLCATKQAALVSKKATRVSCRNETNKFNDAWLILPSRSGTEQRVALLTPFILFHPILNCELMESGYNLPEWGYDQKEIICNPYLGHSANKWIVASNSYPHGPSKRAADISQFSFFDKLVESHRVMITVNNNLLPAKFVNPSQPWHWLFNYKGLHFSLGVQKIYFLGNPILYWSFIAVMPLYLIHLVIYLLLVAGRASLDSSTSRVICETVERGSVHLVGWSIHYLPYYFMSRVLYFHHYLIPYLFYSMLAGTVLNGSIKLFCLLVTPSRRLQALLRAVGMTLVCFVAIVSFGEFSFMAYGMRGPRAGQPGSQYTQYKWLSTWDF